MGDTSDSPRSVADISRGAPATVRKFAYGVWLLFTVAAAVLSLSGDNPGQLILIAIVVFGFLVALFAFDRMIRSEHVVWRNFGYLFGGIVLLILIAAFAAIISSLIIGEPKFVGRLLGGRAHIPLENVRVHATSHQSIAVEWTPNGYDGDNVTVLIEELSKNQPPIPLNTLPRSVGRAELKGLVPYTQYKVILAADYPNGSAVERVIWTHAAGSIVGNFGGYEILYTGPVRADGAIDGDRKTIAFTAGQNLRWTVNAAIKNGLPSGKGNILSSGVCKIEACGSCDGEFRDEAFEGICRLSLYEAGNSERSVYSGPVTAAPSSVQRDQKMGPYRIVLSGEGELGLRGVFNYTGEFKESFFHGKGELKEVNAITVGEFAKDRLIKGYKLESRPGVRLSISEVRQSFTSGAGFIATNNIIRFGHMIPPQTVDSGYILNVAQGQYDFAQYVSGNRTSLGFSQPRNSEACMSDGRLTGMAGDMENAGNWELRCRRKSDGVKACTLTAKSASVDIRAEHDGAGMPVIDITLGRHPDRHRLQIDDLTLSADNPGDGLNVLSPLALAKMCLSTTAKNLNTNSDVSLVGFCPLAATMLSRLLYCG